MRPKKMLKTFHAWKFSAHAFAALTLASLVAVTAGCAHAPSATTPAPPTANARANHADAGATVRFALRYWQYLQTLPPSQLAAEYARVDTVQRRHNEDLHARIQLALLRALPRTAFHDSAGALAMIDGSLDTLPEHDVDQGGNAVEDLLWFMRSFVQEQHNAEQRARALARKSNELRSQLEQLKSIERSLQDRATPNPPPIPNVPPAQGAP